MTIATTCTGVPLAADAGQVQDDAISRLGVWAVCFIYLLGLPGLYLDEPLAQLRYLVYAAPLFLAAPLLYASKIKINRPAVMLFAVYLLAGSAAYLFGQRPESFTVNFVIIALILLSFLPVASVSAKQVRLLFYVTFAYSLAAFILTSHGDARFLLLLQSGTGTGLVDAYDSHEGLLGPIYAVYFLAAGEKGPLGAAIIMSVLGGKRIGLLALLAGFCMVVLFRHYFTSRQARTAALLAIIGTINAVGINLISISESLYSALQIKVHIEEVMLGRHQIGVALTRLTAQKPASEWLLGSGAGAADVVAGSQVKGANGELPHNDWLKVFFDYGLVGSILVTLFIAFTFASSPTGAAIAVASAIMMMTDNVLIYVFYQIPVVLMISCAAATYQTRPQLRRKPQ